MKKVLLSIIMTAFLAVSAFASEDPMRAGTYKYNYGAPGDEGKTFLRQYPLIFLGMEYCYSLTVNGQEEQRVFPSALEPLFEKGVGWYGYNDPNGVAREIYSFPLPKGCGMAYCYEFYDGKRMQKKCFPYQFTEAKEVITQNTMRKEAPETEEEAVTWPSREEAPDEEGNRTEAKEKVKETEEPEGKKEREKLPFSFSVAGLSRGLEEDGNWIHDGPVMKTSLGFEGEQLIAGVEYSLGFKDEAGGDSPQRFMELRYRLGCKFDLLGIEVKAGEIYVDRNKLGKFAYPNSDLAVSKITCELRDLMLTPYLAYSFVLPVKKGEPEATWVQAGLKFAAESKTGFSFRQSIGGVYADDSLNAKYGFQGETAISYRIAEHFLIVLPEAQYYRTSPWSREGKLSLGGRLVLEF